MGVSRYRKAVNHDGVQSNFSHFLQLTIQILYGIRPSSEHRDVKNEILTA